MNFTEETPLPQVTRVGARLRAVLRLSPKLRRGSLFCVLLIKTWEGGWLLLSAQGYIGDRGTVGCFTLSLSEAHVCRDLQSLL